jgi:hypothetical protein
MEGFCARVLVGREPQSRWCRSCPSPHRSLLHDPIQSLLPTQPRVARMKKAARSVNVRSNRLENSTAPELVIKHRSRRTKRRKQQLGMRCTLSFQFGLR